MSAFKDNLKFFSSSTTLEVVTHLDILSIKDIVQHLKAKQAALIMSKDSTEDGQAIKKCNDDLALIKQYLSKANTAINILNVHEKEKKVNKLKADISYTDAIAFFTAAHKVLNKDALDRIKEEVSKTS